jgi:MFS family permease
VLGGWMPGLLAGLIPGLGAQSTAAYAGALLIATGLVIASILPLYGISNEQALPPSQRLKKAASASPDLRRAPWFRFIYLSTPMLFFGFSAGLTFPFYNLFFRERYAASDGLVGVILAIGWFTMGIFAVTGPWWVKRYGASKALLICMSLGMVAFIGLAAATWLPLAVIAFVFAVCLRNLVTPFYQPLYLPSFDENIHNLASAIGSVVWNGGFVMASLLGGVLQQRAAFGLQMVVVAIAVFLVGLSSYLIFKNRPAPVNI